MNPLKMFPMMSCAANATAIPATPAPARSGVMSIARAPKIIKRPIIQMRIFAMNRTSGQNFFMFSFAEHMNTLTSLVARRCAAQVPMRIQMAAKYIASNGISSKKWPEMVM